MSDRAALYLADNLRQLRDLRQLTQLQLSKSSGVPRATIAHVETGGGNPTLAVLVKLSTALGVTIEELIAPPRALCHLYRRQDLPQKRRGKVVVTQLLPDPLPNLALERMELEPGAHMTGVPHTPGTREYLTCEVGRIALVAGGNTWSLEAGDVLVFRGDQKHSYRNPGDTPAVAYSVVALSPP